MSKLLKEYKLTIGIECHVQLKTLSKLFSGASNDDRNSDPNTLVNHIDFGLPGALPVLNKEVIKLASKAAFALNAIPEIFSKFDRKHYFYPDLPMGYQITQFDQPIIKSGYVEIDSEAGTKLIRINRAHIEADAGKSIHPSSASYSLVDLNRANTPLLEIVSEPDMHSAVEAKNYAETLYLLMRYAEVSDANLFYGNMRFDVNVSVSKSSELGVRTEIKNLNSFKAIQKAINYEYDRQVKLLEDRLPVIQETRGWDDNNSSTYSLRSKENSDDYRYMPDPDLPPIRLDEEYIAVIKNSMPKLPAFYKNRLTEKGISSSFINSILLFALDDGNDVLEYLINANLTQAQELAKLVVNITIPTRNDLIEQNSTKKIANFNELKETYLNLLQLSRDSMISSTSLKEYLRSIIIEGKVSKDIKKDIEARGLLQNSDPSMIIELVKEVLSNNPKAAKELQNGEQKVIGFLIGGVMKKTRNQADPKIVAKLIRKELNLE